MKTRVDVGTDVAMIGAWDAQRDAEPHAGAESRSHTNILEADAAAGHVFVLHTGADGGGAVDLYIGEVIPDDVQTRLRPVEGTFLLAVPSGRLSIGGAEDYRAAQPKITGPTSVVTVPSGDYAVRCYVARDAEQAPASEATLRKMVGKADLDYYDRVNNIGCLGGALSLLLFPTLSFLIDWRLALAITAAVFLSFFPLVQWLLKRNERYQRLHAIIPSFRLKNEDAWLVFELQPVGDRTGLQGGSASL